AVICTDLVRQYNANAIAADETYKGRDLLVTGAVYSVGTDLLGNPYVTLYDGSAFTVQTVQCCFGSEARSELARLQRNDVVTVIGRCSGKMMNVVLSDCEIRRAQSSVAQAVDGRADARNTGPEGRELWEALMGNKRAARAYNGKAAIVSGNVESVALNPTYEVVVRGDPGLFLCRFTGPPQGEIKQGARVRICGRCAGTDGQHVILTECEVLY